MYAVPKGCFIKKVVCDECGQLVNKTYLNARHIKKHIKGSSIENNEIKC